MVVRRQRVNHFPQNSPRGTEYAYNSSEAPGKFIFSGSSRLYGLVLQHFTCFTVVIPQRRVHGAQIKPVGSNNPMPSVQSMLQGQGLSSCLSRDAASCILLFYYHLTFRDVLPASPRHVGAPGRGRLMIRRPLKPIFF